MLTKIFAGIAVLMAIWSITDAYSHKSAFVLREEKQTNFVTRRGTSLTGSYGNNGTWFFFSGRDIFGQQRGNSSHHGNISSRIDIVSHGDLKFGTS